MKRKYEKATVSCVKIRELSLSESKDYAYDNETPDTFADWWDK